jgi:hypothetical protein
MNFVFRQLIALVDEVSSWNITAQVLQDMTAWVHQDTFR